MWIIVLVPRSLVMHSHPEIYRVLYSHVSYALFSPLGCSSWCGVGHVIMVWAVRAFTMRSVPCLHHVGTHVALSHSSRR